MCSSCIQRNWVPDLWIPLSTGCVICGGPGNRTSADGKAPPVCVYTQMGDALHPFPRRLAHIQIIFSKSLKLKITVLKLI